MRWPKVRHISPKYQVYFSNRVRSMLNPEQEQLKAIRYLSTQGLDNTVHSISSPRHPNDCHWFTLSSILDKREAIRHSYLIRPTDEAHKLAHAVAVKVGRPKCVLRHQPTRWKDNKIHHGHAWSLGWYCQDCKAHICSQHHVVVRYRFNGQLEATETWHTEETQRCKRWWRLRSSPNDQ